MFSYVTTTFTNEMIIFYAKEKMYKDFGLKRIEKYLVPNIFLLYKFLFKTLKTFKASSIQNKSDSLRNTK